MTFWYPSICVQPSVDRSPISVFFQGRRFARIGVRMRGGGSFEAQEASVSRVNKAMDSQEIQASSVGFVQA